MSQENLQTMIMQNFWEVKEVYYGIVQVVNNDKLNEAYWGRGVKHLLICHAIFLPEKSESTW